MGIIGTLMGGGGGGGLAGIASKFVKNRKSKSGGGSSGSGPTGSESTDYPTYHRGGKVRKTGLARLKKGEQVLTAKQAKRRKGRSKRR